MATEKVSLTLEEELIAEARGAVGARGLSGYINRALRRQLQHDRIAGLLREMEREHGPIGDDAMEEVRRVWPGPGKAAKRSA
jgi:hypothetical protein